MREPARRSTLPLLIALFLSGCDTSTHPAPRYIVTTTPVDVVGGVLVCIAVDPADAHGVWWWQPGPSGCATRITDPTVFAAEHASVTPSRDGGLVEASFKMHFMSGPHDVQLALKDSEMRISGTDVRVSTRRRGDLEIPPAFRRIPKRD